MALSLFAIVCLIGCGSGPATPSAPVVAPPVAVIITPATPSIPPTIPRGPQFSQVFWDEFVHDGFEEPSALQPLRRLTSAPMLYLKTVDEAGNLIDLATLNTVQSAMRDVAAIWGGGQFGFAGVEQGTSTREGQRGWITAKWPNPSAGAFCGRSSIAVDGGAIELNYLRQDVTCGCGASRMRPRTAKHELGHAFGYYHTDSDGDLMRNGVSGCVDNQPSAREVYHASIAYQTQVGSAYLSSLVRPSAVVID